MFLFKGDLSKKIKTILNCQLFLLYKAATSNPSAEGTNIKIGVVQ